jgi:hypothetical protein
MNPLTLALFALGAGTTAYSMFKPKPKGLQPDFWKKYYSSERARASVEPIRQLARNKYAQTSGQAGEKWGGRGLLSSSGAMSEVRGAEQDYGQLMSQALAEAHQGEIEQAGELGVGDWQRNYQEDLAKREMWGQLGSSLMAPQLGTWGRKAGYKEISDLMGNETSLHDLLAKILAGQGVDGMGIYGKNDELIRAFIQAILSKSLTEQSAGGVSPNGGK